MICSLLRERGYGHLGGIHEYPAGKLLIITFMLKKHVRYLNDDILELIIMKAPAPVNCLFFIRR